MYRILKLHVLIIIILLLLSSTSQYKKKDLPQNKTSANKVFFEKNLKLDGRNSIETSNSLKIVTWNIQNLGRSKDSKEILEIARVLRNFDLVAIQEVVAKDPAGAQAVAKIADELNRMGSKWDYRISDPTKSPSVYMSERYAFIWKTSKVSLLSKAYLDKDLEKECVREPYIGKFKFNKGITPFYVVNFHSRKHSDHPEEEIVYFKNYPNKLASKNIFILGDFNLNEKHQVWDGLYELGFNNAVENTQTTLKMSCKNGVYMNHSIDNIYYNSAEVEFINSDHLDFVKICGNLKNARMLSDHLPVFLECIID